LCYFKDGEHTDRTCVGRIANPTILAAERYKPKQSSAPTRVICTENNQEKPK
jgi:hypothetical protein